MEGFVVRGMLNLDSALNRLHHYLSDEFNQVLISASVRGSSLSLHDEGELRHLSYKSANSYYSVYLVDSGTCHWLALIELH